MGERVVFPPAWWIRAYLDERASVLFLPMKPQPFQPGYLGKVSRVSIKYPGAYLKLHWSCGLVEETGIRCSVVPGDTLLVKETYCPWGNGYLYKVGPLECTSPWATWHSPVTMPYEAVRIKPIVAKIAAV